MDDCSSDRVGLGRLNRRELLLVGLGALGVLLALALFGTERAGVLKDDPRHYVLMAEDPTYLARFPYMFRVLTPFLVHLLPLEPVAGFTVVTIAGLWLSALALYGLLRGFGLAPLESAAGLAIFLGSGVTIRMLTTPTYVDPLSYLSNLAGLYFLLVRREALFAATLVLGTLNRETALFLAPVYLLQLRAEGRLGRRDLPRVALVLGLPVLALATVAAAKLIAAGALEHGPELTPARPRMFEQNLPSLQDLAEIYSLFGAGWILALANLRQAPPLLRRSWPLAALVVLQLTGARGDESRNLSHLLPLVLPLAALSFRGRGAGQSLLLVVACLTSMLNFRWLLFPSAVARYTLVALGTVAALGLGLTRRPAQRQLQPAARV